eukprot:m.339152 g.339152  ORF g.339152 m.339152 type:complete len:813 (+) comp18686_c0_seq1:84-2522(+)
MALLIFLASLGLAAAHQDLTINTQDTESMFWGLGGLSGGGATSRLLVDYQEPQRSQILDILFKPNYAASLQVLKVEIGGDSQSTDGTETSHMHSEDDLNFKRGYEWWLMKEAKARNPDIKLYGLAWAYPGWVGNGTDSPFSAPELTSHYISEWIRGAKEVYDLDIDYIGVWNERSSSATYVKYLKSVLLKNGQGNTKIVAKDGGADICQDMAADPEYAAAIDIIGLHYPSDYNNYSLCHSLNKPFWASEESSSYDDLNGAACWARVVTSHWVLSKITSSIMWNLVGSYAHGTNWYASSMLTAVQPWSGYYGDDIDGTMPVVWATAHVTQFTSVGWQFLKVGSGSSELSEGGFMATLVSPDGKDITILINKISREHAPCTRPKLPDFNVTEQTLTIGNIPDGISALNFYYSNYEDNSGDEFVEKSPLSVAHGSVTITVPIGAMITLSTLKGTKGNIPDRPTSQPKFPLPYKDDFQSYNDSSEARYLSDQIGAFEIHPEVNGSKNMVMEMMVPETPIGWSDHGSLGPMTLTGMREWQDLTVQVDYMLPSTANSTASACVATRVDQMWRNGIVFCVQQSGMWTISVGGPKLMTNIFTKVFASGQVDNKLDTFHTLSLTTNGSMASASFDGIVISGKGVPIQDVDTGFAAFGGSHWVPMKFDNFAISDASSQYYVDRPMFSVMAGQSICNAPCARNGMQAPEQAFDITSSWQMRHVQSKMCAEFDSTGKLSLQDCVFNKDSQRFLNDYTRIRNSAVSVTTSTGVLTGDSDGSVAVANQPKQSGWKTWSYFPNTKQLRNQYDTDMQLGYPRCLSICN